MGPSVFPQGLGEQETVVKAMEPFVEASSDSLIWADPRRHEIPRLEVGLKASTGDGIHGVESARTAEEICKGKQVVARECHRKERLHQGVMHFCSLPPFSDALDNLTTCR